MSLQTPISYPAVAADSAVPKSFMRAGTPEPEGSSYRMMDNARVLRIAFSGLVIFFGLVEFWINRDSTNTDGISYLDLGSAFARHDWSAAVNAYWSPLYPFLLGIALRLLKPAAYWEFTVAHLVNFLIFAGAAAAFQFFLSRFMLYRSARIASADLVTWSVLPDWSVRALGYTLFLWSSLQLITIAVLSPDMTVELFVYLAAGIVLGMRAKGIARVRDFFLLGIVLGFGYLAKAPMLPMGMVFLAIALFSAGGVKKSIVRISAAALAIASGGSSICSDAIARKRPPDVGGQREAELFLVRQSRPALSLAGHARPVRQARSSNEVAIRRTTRIWLRWPSDFHVPGLV